MRRIQSTAQERLAQSCATTQLSVKRSEADALLCAAPASPQLQRRPAGGTRMMQPVPILQQMIASRILGVQRCGTLALSCAGPAIWTGKIWKGADPVKAMIKTTLLRMQTTAYAMDAQNQMGARMLRLVIAPTVWLVQQPQLHARSYAALASTLPQPRRQPQLAQQ